MNYRADLEKSIAFIESHLEDPLTAEQIAAAAGYSLYHFCRVFALCWGTPLMEYVRRRRLSRAAAAIERGQKVLDAALQYGFETASGFTRAFRREFGCTPTQFIRYSMEDRFICTKKMTGECPQGGAYMSLLSPVIVSKPAFKVAGYGIETDIANANYTRDVATFWEHYEGENLETKLYEILTPPRHGEVGICVPSKKTNATYLLGVVVDDFSKATPDMMRVIVPAARYAVFTTPPVDASGDPDQLEFAQIIRDTWHAVFTKWFPSSRYRYDENGFDFEYYDERCHGCVDAVMEIYVPIIEK